MGVAVDDGLVLVCRVRGAQCALPLAHVVEIMRPLPVEATANTPRCVRGIAIVRGEPQPVVDLGALVAPEAPQSPPRRFVTLRAGGRHASVAVDAVVAVRALPAGHLRTLPPLLRGAGDEVVAALGTLDRELLRVLDAARLVPEPAGSAPAGGGGGA